MGTRRAFATEGERRRFVAVLHAAPWRAANPQEPVDVTVRGEPVDVPDPSAPGARAAGVVLHGTDATLVLTAVPFVAGSQATVGLSYELASADIRQRPWYPRWVDRRPHRVWAFVALALLIVACAAACVVYWFVPYEPGPWHQRWTVTVSHGGRTAASTGFGLGRCGDEGDHGATVAKRGALGRACYSAGLCPGDAVCDCASAASVRTRCEAERGPGRTRLGDRITVPIH